MREHLLTTAFQRGATDAHLHPGRPVMLKVEGRLAASELGPYGRSDAVVLDLLDQQARAELSATGSAQCSVRCKAQGQVRVNAYRQSGKLGAWLRFHPLSILRRDIRLPESLPTWMPEHRALILVSGQPGSGMTTTLAQLADTINGQRQCHILTLDEPSEIVLTPGLATITSRDVTREPGGWRVALREARCADVIVIAQLHGAGMVKAAVDLALEGKLVLAGFRASGIYELLHEVWDNPPIVERFSKALAGILHRQLIPAQTGLVPATEVLVVNPSVRELLAQTRPFRIYNEIQTGHRFGMNTMEQALVELVSDGSLTREEALGATQHPDEVERMLHRLQPEPVAQPISLPNIQRETFSQSPRELGLPVELESLLYPDQGGLVLVTSPSGGGRSTTLQWMLNYLNQNLNGHLMTFEDPIEKPHASRLAAVSLRQKGIDYYQLTPSLRETSKMGVQVVLIGDLSSLQAIKDASRTARDGRLVLAGMAAESAVKAAARLDSAFPPAQRSELKDSLRAIIHQRLVRGTRLAVVPVVEILLATPSVRQLFLERKLNLLYGAMETGSRTGMRTLEQALAAGVKGGLFSKKEALRHTTLPQRLQELLS